MIKIKFNWTFKLWKLIELIELNFFVFLFNKGRPLPKVTWWRDNVLLNSTTIHLSDKKVKNILQLNKLERRDLHNSYVCQSSNNDVSEPITSSVSLDLNCKHEQESFFHSFSSWKWFSFDLFSVVERDRVIELDWIGNRLSDCDSITCVAYNNVSLKHIQTQYATFDLLFSVP